MEFCNFFDLNPAQACREDCKISVPGLKRNLFPFQAYGVYWSMKQEQGIVRGGIIGDEMGLGKTTHMIAFCVMQANLARAIQDRNKAWEENDNHRHLPKHTDLTPQSPEARCPSKLRYGMRCPCEHWGPTSSWKVWPTASMIIVKPNLKANFLEEWTRIVDEEKGPRMRLIVGHGSQNMTPAEKQMLCVQATLQKKHDGHNLWHYDVKYANPNVGQSSYVFLTTPMSWKDHYKAILTAPYEDQHKGDGNRRIRVPRSYHIIPWARVIVDEFHAVKNRETIPMQLLRSLPKEKSCRWVYSGTPLGGNPGTAIGGFLDALRDSSWDHEPSLLHAREEQFKNLCSDYNRIMRCHANNQEPDPVSVSSLGNRLKGVLQMIMLQRKCDSMWGKRPLLPGMPKRVHTDVLCDLKDSTAGRINTLMNDIFSKHGKNKDFRTLFFQYANPVRIATDFPGLLTLNREHGLGLLQEDITKSRLYDWNSLQGSLLWAHRNMLSQTSPKYQKLRSWEQNQMLCKETGCLKPHLIMSFSPMVALVVWMVSEFASPHLFVASGFPLTGGLVLCSFLIHSN